MASPGASDTPGPYRTFVGPPFAGGADGRAAAFCPVSGRAAAVDGADLRLLAACQAFAPLADHARRGCLALGLPPDREAAVHGHLTRLVVAGLLVSADEVLEMLAAADGGRFAPVSVIGIPTRDRPALLARCLADLADACDRAYRTPEVVVADGSPDPGVRAAARSAVAAVRGRFPGGVVHIGAAERAAYAEALITAGADADAVRFALLPDESLFAAGANRNLLALAAAGRVLVSLDDDTLSRTARVPGATSGLAVTARGDPTEFWYPPDIPPPDDLGPPADIAAEHEALLGRSVADGLARGPGRAAVTGVDAGLLVRVRAAGGVVRVTTAGVAGDSGMGATLYHLSHRGPSRDRLHASEAVYRRAMVGGPVLRAVTRPTVTGGSVCMGLNLGLDLRDVLPPFPPVLRNEDGVFGAAVQVCCPGALMGHLPAAVWHRQGASPRYSAADLDAWGGGFRAEHLFSSFVRTCAPPLPTTDVRRNLRVLGEGLMGLGGLGAAEFRAGCRAVAFDLAAGMATPLAALVDEYGAAPAWWAADVARFAGLLRDTAARPDAGVPKGLGDDADVALSRLQGIVGRYGHLLAHWPDIVDAALALRADGITPWRAVA